MEAGWEVGVAPWLQRPTLLSRTWSRCRRVPRGDDRIWLPASQQALKWAGRDLLCSVPSGRHIGVSRVGQATVHSADLPREPADALSSALTGHGGNRSEASGTPGVGWASRAGFTNAASVATALSGR